MFRVSKYSAEDIKQVANVFGLLERKIRKLGTRSISEFELSLTPFDCGLFIYYMEFDYICSDLYVEKSNEDDAEDTMYTFIHSPKYGRRKLSRALAKCRIKATKDMLLSKPI